MSARGSLLFSPIGGRRATILAVVAAVLLSAPPLVAQSSTYANAETHTGWIFRWLNFVILVVLLVYAFTKAGPQFRSKTEEISRQIAEGARAREAAEQQRRDVRTRMAGIPSEVAAMREDAQRGAEAESERIRALAISEVATIDRAAQAEIAAAERASRLALRSTAARLAVEGAEQILRQQLNARDESALFRTFVVELDRSPN